MPKLHEKLSVISEASGESSFKDKVDKIICDNLHFGQEIRPYQKEAFEVFFCFGNGYFGEGIIRKKLFVKNTNNEVKEMFMVTKEDFRNQ